MTEPALSPRARAILDAVEREVQARRRPASEPVRPLRVDPTLLAALELAVAGASREEVRARLEIAEDALDAVFGDGSPPQARLTRRAPGQ